MIKLPSFHKTPAPDSSQNLTPGAKHLLILGASAVGITFLTTAVSLKLYHDSGDIYLDRSRPGFLPEEDESEKDKDDADFVFSDTGKITREALEEYLKNLRLELNRLNEFSDPYGATPLSDESLGI